MVIRPFWRNPSTSSKEHAVEICNLPWEYLLKYKQFQSSYSQIYTLKALALALALTLGGVGRFDLFYYPITGLQRPSKKLLINWGSRRHRRFSTLVHGQCLNIEQPLRCWISENSLTLLRYLYRSRVIISFFLHKIGDFNSNQSRSNRRRQYGRPPAFS